MCFFTGRYEAMRVLFVCSSSESGVDGVGDYTRTLADECVRYGHECALLALNDPFVKQSESHEDEGVGIRMKRLAAGLNRDQRILAATSFLQRFRPDWISLQFVCYGFHPKGYVFWLPSNLAPLFHGLNCHIMLHELWIGESTDYGLKDRAEGLLQKWGVLRLLRTLKPALVHTSNPVYVEILKRNGVRAEELPLPGNIPITEGDTDVWKEILRKQVDRLGVEDRENHWMAGVFGTIHPEWEAGKWLDRLCDSARENRRRLLLLHLGRSPETGLIVWNRLAEEYAGRCDFIDLGAMSAERISMVLQALDFGIATSPWALIGKSGSVAAMLDHGIPVLVPRDDWKLRRGSTPEPAAHPLLFRFGESFLQQLGRGLRKLPPRSRWPEVTEQFLRSFGSKETSQTTVVTLNSPSQNVGHES